MINAMHVITDRKWVRLFFFTTLLTASYNFIGQSLSFSYVQSYFGVSSKDALWLLRGFQSATIITGIAGLVFIKWIGNRNLFIGSAFILMIATLISFNATAFSILLVFRIAAGTANGFMIAVSTQMFLSTYEGKTKVPGSLYTVAANIGGLCLGMLANSLFTEDHGWQFNYYLSVPVLVVIIIFLFFFVPHKQKKRQWSKQRTA